MLGMSIRTKCYDLFKEAFPDTYKDILSVHDEVKMLSASPQTVSQRAQEFQKYYRRMFSIVSILPSRLTACCALTVFIIG
jgi:hypothetical protein